MSRSTGGETLTSRYVINSRTFMFASEPCWSDTPLTTRHLALLAVACDDGIGSRLAHGDGSTTRELSIDTGNQYLIRP